MRREGYENRRYFWGESWGGYGRIWPSDGEGHSPLLDLERRVIPREERL